MVNCVGGVSSLFVGGGMMRVQGWLLRWLLLLRFVTFSGDFRLVETRESYGPLLLKFLTHQSGIRGPVIRNFCVLLEYSTPEKVISLGESNCFDGCRIGNSPDNSNYFDGCRTENSPDNSNCCVGCKTKISPDISNYFDDYKSSMAFHSPQLSSRYPETETRPVVWNPEMTDGSCLCSSSCL